MANTQAMCTSFKAELLTGIHAPGPGTGVPARTAATADVVKAALYLATATMNAATTAYSATNEVSGTNYTAGGVAVTTATAPTTNSTSGVFTPSASITYGTTGSPVTLSTAFDTVLLYNSSQGNKAISVHTFGSQTITAGVLTLTMPSNVAGSALLELA